MQYNLPPQEVNQLVENCIHKGLIIDDLDYAKGKILNIGYFRLTRFMEHFFIIGDKGKKTFYEGTNFNEIIDLYVFDSQLRSIIFEAIAHIEVAVKSLMNFEMTLKYGTHWYLNPSLFKEKFTTSEPGIEREYDKFISKLKKDCKDSNERYVTSYRLFWDTPDLPPSWVIMELISFGTCGQLYQNIQDTEVRGRISNFFNCNQKMFETWLYALSFIRNSCAHHQKITYKKVKFPPILPRKKQYCFLSDPESVDKESLYSVMCIIQYCLKRINIHPLFRECIIDLIEYNPQISLSDLGFTDNWRDENIWKE